MPISWNEIRPNAVAFAKDWAGVSREEAEAKTFWDEFFKVFGIKRRTVASFEEPVKNLAGHWSFIDLFWKRTLIVEHKSRGKPLDKAAAQAMDCIQALKNEGRGDEIPRYVIFSDFARIALHDPEEDASVEFALDAADRPAGPRLVRPVRVGDQDRGGGDGKMKLPNAARRATQRCSAANLWFCFCAPWSKMKSKGAVMPPQPKKNTPGPRWGNRASLVVATG